MTSLTGNVGSEIIEILPYSDVRHALWHPIVGSETNALLNHFVIHLNLLETSREVVEAEALNVLSRCTPPHSLGPSETGLVIGYVQSGKTMNFTTVAALARDNGYPMVIVITGISKPLFNQSTERLEKDLRLDTRPDRKWKQFSNPTTGGGEHVSIADTLDEWKDSSVPEDERQTVLITVMKNSRHLDNMIDLLSNLSLTDVPTLVIDDEADQAGLNTLVKRGEQSAIYRRLLQLRECLPHHSYLQYTATPQAPLLINLIDILSPKFAEILTPGRDYVGGKEFFLEKPQLIRVIPEDEIPTKDDLISEPLESLLEAMRIFFLGVAAGLVHNGGRNRSMLVHPSQKVVGHKRYLHWVTQAKESWKEILELEVNNSDRQELIEEFEQAYHDLDRTVKDLPRFEALIDRLLRAIRMTRIQEVNAARGKTPEIHWRSDYAHILVGGQAMDRGFTVEGLTVTYMPRGLGVGHADTFQQRARFFGYKRQYLGYCRVYLDAEAREAYRNYVIHEEDIRKQLLDLRDAEKSLADWKREFFLDRELQPTRKNVLDLDYMRVKLGDTWFAPKAPHDSIRAIEANRQIVKAFLDQLELHLDDGDSRRTPMQKHNLAEGVSLAIAYEQLLTQLRVTRPDDSQRFTRLLLGIEAYLRDHPNATCAVYQMSQGRLRERSIDENDEIPNLFQGEHPLHSGAIYRGDRHIRATRELTIQIHNLQVTAKEDGDRVIAENVPAVTVWVPADIAPDSVVQNQGGSD